MYFPIPIPFESEYPVILNLCEPLMVSVIDVEEVVDGIEGGDGDEDDDDDEFEDGLVVSRRILPIREPREGELG